MKKLIGFPHLPIRIAASNVKYKSIHYHPDVLEVLFVLENRLAVTMEQQSFFVTEGEFLVINPGQPHTIFCDGISVTVSLYFDLKHYAELFPHLMGTRFLCCRHSLRDEQFLSWAQIRNYFIRIMLMHNKNTPSAQTIIQDLAEKIIQVLWENLQEREQLPDHVLERYYSIGSYLYQNYKDELSVTQVAEHENISVTRLAHFWKDVSGRSIRQTLTRYRLLDAEKMLLETPLAVNEIAYRCGFSDEKYFYQHFKSCYKSTPNEYRIRYLENQQRTVRELLSRRESEHHVFVYAMKFYTSELAPVTTNIPEEERQKEAVLSCLYNTILTHPHMLVEQIRNSGQAVSYLHVTLNKALMRSKGQTRLNWEYVYAQMHIFLERGLSSNVLIDYDCIEEQDWRPLLHEYVEELITIWGKHTVESQHYSIHSKQITNYRKCIELANYLKENTAVVSADAIFML